MQHFLNIFSFVKKLSFKIGLLAALISWISIEIVIRLVIEHQLDKTRISVQNNLQTLANIAAYNLSGDDHVRAFQNDSLAPLAFERFRQQLQRLRRATGYKDEWYTFLPSFSDTATFGIMTHTKPFSGDNHIFRDSSVLRLFRTTITNKVSLATEIYTDDHGVWISGFAPIVNSGGAVVAVLEIDMTYSEYQKQEAAIFRFFAIIRAIGFIIAGLLGLVIGWITARPVRLVSNAVAQITQNNFQGLVRIPLSLRFHPDETTTLISNVNKMTARLDETLHTLRIANEHLQSLDQAKSVFLEFVAHELRTPLTPLHIIEYFAQNNTLPEDDRSLLQAAAASVERLRSLSLSAEHYVRALTHTPVLHEELNLDELLRSLVDEYISSLGITTYSFQFSTPPVSHEPLFVQMPYKVLFIIISEILENSVKFSPEHSSIHIRLWGEKGFAYCSIQDFGVGIAPELQERVFEPFFVEDIHHHQQGVGVNLAMAKVYARHYHGDVQVFSEGKGMGTTFTVILPLSRKKTAEQYSRDHSAYFRQSAIAVTLL